jgi:RNA polymerase sigma-70 factor (ECF subfamily)
LDVSRFRAGVLAHCYRMMGSYADAEDMTQDVMARATEALPTFEGRAALETWLYRIATNRCLDELKSGKRRELPVGDGVQIGGDDDAPAAREPAAWIGPFPVDPQAKLLAGESIRLAFIAALQRLTPRHRAVLLLRDVLGWEATEVARALRTTTSAVTNALHRARQIARVPRSAAKLSAADRALLDRYVHAWTAGDAAAFAALLSSDATFSMPPNPAWLLGPAAIERYARRVLFKGGATRRLVPIVANGAPGFAVYARGKPHAIHVVSLAAGPIGREISEVVSFRDPSLFPAFGL